MNWRDDAPTTPIRLNRATLELLQVAVKRRVEDSVGGTLLDSLECTVDGMAVELKGTVLAEKLPPEVVERTEVVDFVHPDGWWQLFRETYRRHWWMRWSRGRWPVRTTKTHRRVTLTVSVGRFRTFPQASVPPPAALGVPVNVAIVEERVMRW